MRWLKSGIGLNSACARRRNARMQRASVAILRTLIAALVLGTHLITPPAFASKRGTVEFDATSGTPITIVQIGKESFRFALDPLLGPFVTVNPDAQDRLAVKSIRDEGIKAKIDGVEIKGSLAKIVLRAGQRRHTVEAALMGRDHLPEGKAQSYDIAGGFEALPGHYVVVHLNREITGPKREITLSRQSNDLRPGFPIGVADLDMRLNVHFANSTTWLDRRAAEALINLQLLEATGEITEIPVWYGLRMSVQRVLPLKPIALKGIALTKLQARTSETLILPEPDENVILVQRTKQGAQLPSILLGFDTLKQCAKLVFDQRKRRMTLTCPA